MNLLPLRLCVIVAHEVEVQNLADWPMRARHKRDIIRAFAMNTMGSGLDEPVPLPGVLDSGLVDPTLAPLDNLDPNPPPDPTPPRLTTEENSAAEG